MMMLKNAKVIVLGAGKSGTAAVEFLLDRGAVVSLYDGADTEKEIYAGWRRRGVSIYAGVLPPRW